MKLHHMPGAGSLVDLTVLPMDEPASLRGLFLVVFAEAPATNSRRLILRGMLLL